MTTRKTFRAFRTEETENGFISSVKEIELRDLNENEVLIKAEYSSLNYKDALSASGNKGVTRNYPHTAGIDVAGTIESSNSEKLNTGEKVIATSYDLGMNTDGGFAEYVIVPSDWVVKLPKNLSTKEAMAYGTAGLTAAICIQKITRTIKPEDGKIAISGATGGVGSLAISILSKLNYKLVAISGKESEYEYLHKLGANEILSRQEIEAFANKPLLKPLFIGAVDAVGGSILENIIKSTDANGVVSCCGNAASFNLSLTVFPFILRGVSLMGVDSQNYPMQERQKAWDLLAYEWKINQIADFCDEIKLEDLNEKIKLMLDGKLKRRVIVKL
ncbi:MAG: YhdH/YhfP family quinone oxidoreductase [Marinifilaceae bacterium]|jgi:putative YhdH/YhfP family quinone oxidoreductase|nr:YhdH/YhfP family quinone oxidoreductase [Marinifilaceae bacterium]